MHNLYARLSTFVHHSASVLHTALSFRGPRDTLRVALIPLNFASDMTSRPTLNNDVLPGMRRSRLTRCVC